MITEISYILDADMPRWPTNPAERLEKVLSFENGDPNNAFSCYHHMHNGTHVDAPGHFSRGAKMIEEIPVEDFYYTNPVLLDFPRGKGGSVGREELQKYEDILENADLVCLYFHYADIRAKDPCRYVDDFPTMTPEAAVYLRSRFPKLKAVAVDVVGVDSTVTASEAGFPVHKALLDGDGYRPLLIYEDVDLKKMSEISGSIKEVCAFPVRWKGAEAGPVSMAVISE